MSTIWNWVDKTKASVLDELPLVENQHLGLF